MMRGTRKTASPPWRGGSPRHTFTALQDNTETRRETSPLAVFAELMGDLVAEVHDLREQVSAFERELLHLGDRIEDTRERQKRDLERLARNLRGLTVAVADVRILQADIFRDRGAR